MLTVRLSTKYDRIARNKFNSVFKRKITSDYNAETTLWQSELCKK